MTKSWHLHVDWDGNDKEMNLDSIRWVTSQENNRKRAIVKKNESGQTIAELAELNNLEVSTARSWFRKGKSLDGDLYSNYDLKIQRKKFMKIKELIDNGEYYVDMDGRIYEIKDRLPLSRKSTKKDDYTQLKLNCIGVNVSTHHVVLIYWAGLPPLDGKVWHGDHINGIKHENTPENLCWMSHENNIAKRNLSPSQQRQYVDRCVKEGNAIECIIDKDQPHSKVTEAFANKENLKRDKDFSHYEIGFTELPNNLELLRVFANNVPLMNSDLLLRILLSSKNQVKIQGETCYITDTKGFTKDINELTISCSSSFYIVYFAEEIICNLEKINVPEARDIIDEIIQSIPKNTIIESVKQVEIRSTFRRPKKNKDEFDALDLACTFKKALLFTLQGLQVILNHL